MAKQSSTVPHNDDPYDAASEHPFSGHRQDHDNLGWSQEQKDAMEQDFARHNRSSAPSHPPTGVQQPQPTNIEAPTERPYGYGDAGELPWDASTPGVVADLRAKERRDAGLPAENVTAGDKTRVQDLPDFEDMSPELQDELLKQQHGEDVKGNQKSIENARQLVGDLEKKGILSKAEAGSKNGGEKQKLFQKVKKYSKKKKLKIAAAGVGLAGAFFLLMLFMFLLGTLLLPHFMSNVLGYEFVRVTRAAYQSDKAVVGEQTADAANKDTAAGVAAEDDFGKLKDGETNDVMEDIEDTLSPEAMNEASEAENGSIKNAPFSENANSEGQLKSITYEDDAGNYHTVDVSGGFEDGNIKEPGIMENTTTAGAVTEAETQALGIADPEENGDSLVSVQEETSTAAETGLPDYGLNDADFPDDSNESSKAADEQAEKDIVKDVDDDQSAGQDGLSGIDSDEDTAASDFSSEMTDSNVLSQVADQDGNLSTALIKLINNDFTQNALSSILNEIEDTLNPASGRLLPFCIIYQNSKFNGPTAESQSDEDQRAAIVTSAVTDQQKRGSPYVTANMVGAMNWKLEGDSRSGGVNDSIPIERASGENVSTTSQLSAEGSPLGDTQTTGNILSALGIPLASQLSSVFDTICPILTNTWANIGLGLANLSVLGASLFGTAGVGDAGEETLEAAAEEGATEAATEASEKITENVASDAVTNSSSSGLSLAQDFGKGVIKFGKQTIIQGGLIAMASFLAKFIVIYQSGIFNSGIATGQQYDDQVDQGSNILANSEVANAYGGRPLTNTEAIGVNADDNATLADINSSQSAYQRYLAISNPQSLASILVDRVAINLNYGFFGSVLTDIGNIFNPTSLVPQVFFGDLSRHADAASDIDTQDYGDVQQGYSDTEYNLIDSTPSYKIPSENEYYLYESGDEPTIAATYGPCFTESVAELLANDDIVRGQNGNVENQGLCSPQNLGPNNPQYGDNVFRYRLSLSYNTTISMLQGLAYANGTIK